MSLIRIEDLEVFYCVGVTDAERANPQRLLLTVVLEFDISAAAFTDRISKTIDYYAVAQTMIQYGTGRSWKLIEKVAVSVADLIMAEYHPESVSIEVKKFSVPQAAFVSVTWSRR
jgi:7,8-dihydroneopterin aldolase/epimerase/oxygenase